MDGDAWCKDGDVDVRVEASHSGTVWYTPPARSKTDIDTFTARFDFGACPRSVFAPEPVKPGGTWCVDGATVVVERVFTDTVKVYPEGHHDAVHYPPLDAFRAQAEPGSCP